VAAEYEPAIQDVQPCDAAGLVGDYATHDGITQQQQPHDGHAADTELAEVMSTPPIKRHTYECNKQYGHTGNQ
jgi:hypothetical protein